MTRESDEVWPDASELKVLTREASEHRRVWGIVGGLCNTLTNERAAKPYPSSEEQNARIQSLEEKIVKQRKFLATIEGCREFEKETERLLVVTLAHIGDLGNDKKTMARMAEDALEEYRQRKGPRPVDNADE